jgi:hypothetical protein
MKARVKATGEIVEVDFYTTTKRGKLFCEVTKGKGWFKPDESHRKFYRDEIEFLSYEDTPDYWTRLEHQYAGMAMQQLVHLVNVGYEYVYEETAIIATNFAHALVEKLKEKEERK